MRFVATFFIGIFTAALLSGVWWLSLIAGLIVLSFRRSYFVLFGGLLLDLLFATSSDTFAFGGFFTFLFLP